MSKHGWLYILIRNVVSQIEPQITCSVYIDNFKTLDFANKGLE